MSVEAVARELRAGGAAGVIAVHLYGHPADVEALNAVAAPFGAWVIEDACQAHLARARGVRVGGLGRIGCFSFYPSKNLGATGEGGAVTTNEPELADAIRELRSHGQPAPHRHERIGYNARLGELTAAALRIKLRHLQDWTHARRRVAARYAACLAGGDAIRLPYTEPWAQPVWHLYPVEVEHRDAVRATLRELGIATGCTTRRRSTCSRRTRIWGTARARSRKPSATPPACCRCRCSRSSRTRRSIVSSKDCWSPPKGDGDAARADYRRARARWIAHR